MHKRDIHGGCITVPLIRIDDLALTGVKFMKVDVEGHELAVLCGAEVTIRRDWPRLVVEVETRIQAIDRILALLGGWGYDGWVLHRRSWRPLAGFDLAGRQAATLRVANRGWLARRSGHTRATSTRSCSFPVKAATINRLVKARTRG